MSATMNTADFEKIAGQLATCAVTRDVKVVGHIKQAAGYTDQAMQYLSSPAGKYLLGGLGGAGVGALIGATQPKKKGRNALYYGALGGMGGLGLAHLINSAGGVKAPPAAAAKADAAAAKPDAAAPKQDVVPAVLDEISKPTVAGKPAPELTGRMELDAPIQAAHVAQQLPGMEGVSPAAQAGLGATGLYAGVRGSRPLPGMFARRADRLNQSATTAANTAVDANTKYIENHNTRAVNQARALAEQEMEQARIRGQQAADTLRQLGGSRDQARAVYQRHINAARQATAQSLNAAESLAARELARVGSENAARMTRVNNSNAWRSFRGRALPQLLRSLIMGGTTYAGATAPNWAPQLYNSANEAYNEAIR